MREPIRRAPIRGFGYPADMFPLIDTANLSPGDQFAFYEAALQARLAPFRLDRRGAANAPFAARLRARSLAGMDLVHGQGGAHAIGQNRACGAANPYRYGLVMALHGCVAVQTLAGRTDVIAPGTLILTDNHHLPGALSFPRRMNVLTLQVPAGRLPPQATARLAAGPVLFDPAQRHPAAPHARLLACFMAGLPRLSIQQRSQQHSVQSHAAEAAHADQLSGLLTLALREQGIIGEAPLTHGDMDQVYARAADMLMARRLHCANLTPARLAAELGISERHLFRVLTDTGQRFGPRLRQQRLAAAAADLADPLQAHRSVLDIAVAQGFVNQSHFSRAFRETYGCAPGVWRTSAGITQ